MSAAMTIVPLLSIMSQIRSASAAAPSSDSCGSLDLYFRTSTFEAVFRLTLIDVFNSSLPIRLMRRL